MTPEERAAWLDHQAFMDSEDATSAMCAGCGEIVEIPPELRGGAQVDPYYCDACEKRIYDDCPSLF